MQEMHIPGLSLAVVKDGKVIKAAGYGLANVETKTPATAETVYKTASLSKPVIAAAVMLLVQDGRVGLDDKISRYLDDSPGTWQEITIRRLLTHTSGLVRDPSDYRPYEDRRIIAVIRDAYSLPLAFQPGEKWLYSNIGYYVLAEVISRASGRLYPKVSIFCSQTYASEFFEPQFPRGLSYRSSPGSEKTCAATKVGWSAIQSHALRDRKRAYTKGQPAEICRAM